MLVGLVHGDEWSATTLLTQREASSAIRVVRRASMYVHFLEGLMECLDYVCTGGSWLARTPSPWEIKKP